MKSINVKDLNKSVNKKIDGFGKAAGMNYFERKKFKKAVNGFAYDTGVQVASTLIVEGVNEVAYLAGRGIVITAKGVATVGKAGANLVANTAKTAGTTIKNTNEKMASKKAEKASKKDKTKAKDASEEVTEVVEEMLDGVMEAAQEFAEDVANENEAAEESSEN